MSRIMTNEEMTLGMRTTAEGLRLGVMMTNREMTLSMMIHKVME